MTQYETLYMFLDSAWGQIPGNPHPKMPLELKELLDLTASEISKEVDPKTVSDIRNYNPDGAVVDGRIYRDLLGYLLEKSPEVEKDPSLVLFEMLSSIDVHNILDAPVETPSELARWIVAEADRRAAKSSRPIPRRQLLPI